MFEEKKTEDKRDAIKKKNFLHVHTYTYKLIFFIFKTKFIKIYLYI